MSADPHPDDELNVLLAALVEETLDDEQFSRLEALLLSNPAARKDYHIQMQVHSLLLFTQPEVALEGAGCDLVPCGEAAGRSELASAVQPVVESALALTRPPLPAGRWFRAMGASWIAATVLVAAVIYGTFALMVWQMGQFEALMLSRASQVVGDQPAAGVSLPADSSPGAGEAATVAMLVGEDHCVWRQGRSGRPRTGGRFLANDSAELMSGTAHVVFNDGVSMVVEGPSRFTLQGTNGGRLDAGRVLVSVPRRAVGFSLDTPTARIVDLGTKFGVDVAADGTTETLVLRGSVEVLPQVEGAFSDPLRLTATQGLRVNDRRVTRFTDAQGLRFGSLLRSSGTSLTMAPPASQPEYVAYVVPAGTLGHQSEYPGQHGTDFIVHRAIEITQFGVFDHASDGLKRTLTFRLWSRDDNGTLRKPADDVSGRLLATMTFTPEDAGKLIEGSRFKPLAAPWRLEPGSYTISVSGYGETEPNGNLLREVPWKMVDGHGVIEFMGTGRFTDSAEFPKTLNTAEVPNPYAAGTFIFRRVAPDGGLGNSLRNREEAEGER